MHKRMCTNLDNDAESCDHKTQTVRAIDIQVHVALQDVFHKVHWEEHALTKTRGMGGKDVLG